MSDDEAIKALLERWFDAVATGDLAGTVAAHTDDVVMYDVPGPSQATSSIEEYADVWPDFFAWQQHGAVFELRQLSVTAGTDVAFAHALVRCGEADAPDDPDTRLRITFGLRKEDGQWRIAHEHHSAPDNSLAEQQRDDEAL